MQLNHSSPTPLYYQLRQMIRNNIVDGVWQDGMMLPSETQLATELKLSRQTVKQAYDGLVQEGLVSRKRGKGTYVTYRQAEFNIMQEPNFYQQMDDERAVQLAKTIEKGFVKADAHVAKRLRLQVGDDVACIKRVRYINDLASIIQTVYIKKEYMGELLDIDSSAISWHKYVEDYNHIYLNLFEMIINAIDLDPYECDLLEVGHSTPGFRFMTTYWHDDDPIVYNDRVFRGDAVHLALRFSYDRENNTTKYNEFGILRQTDEE